MNITIDIGLILPVCFHFLYLAVIHRIPVLILEMIKGGSSFCCLCILNMFWYWKTDAGIHLVVVQSNYIITDPWWDFTWTCYHLYKFKEILMIPCIIYLNNFNKFISNLVSVKLVLNSFYSLLHTDPCTLCRQIAQTLKYVNTEDKQSPMFPHLATIPNIRYFLCWRSRCLVQLSISVCCQRDRHL